MKLVRRCPTFACGAALAIAFLSDAQVHAAGPIKVIAPSWGLSPDFLARKQSGIGLTVETGGEWSPNVTNWSGYDATFRSENAQGRLAKILDRRGVRSRFTLSRRRISVKITMGF